MRTENAPQGNSYCKQTHLPLIIKAMPIKVASRYYFKFMNLSAEEVSVAGKTDSLTLNGTDWKAHLSLSIYKGLVPGHPRLHSKGNRLHRCPNLLAKPV